MHDWVWRKSSEDGRRMNMERWKIILIGETAAFGAGGRTVRVPNFQKDGTEDRTLDSAVITRRLVLVNGHVTYHMSTAEL